jgi:hypothetical protein
MPLTDVDRSIGEQASGTYKSSAMSPYILFQGKMFARLIFVAALFSGPCESL